MSKEIIERVTIATAERPIKGFALDSAMYVAETKQSVLDEQTISFERTARLVVWAKDIQRFMTFSANGETYEEKQFPTGDANLDDYVRVDSAEVDFPLIKMDGKKVATENFAIGYTDSKLDKAFSPSTPVESVGKDADLSEEGYLSNYAGVAFPNGKIEAMKFNQSFCELIIYASVRQCYVMLSVEQMSTIYGRELGVQDAYLGLRMDGVKGIAGKYNNHPPVNLTLGSKWDHRYRAIPNIIPNDPQANLVDANDDANTFFLDNDGSITTKENATIAGYTNSSWVDTPAFNGADWGYSVRRGYIMQDGSFTPSIDSPYYVTAIDRNHSLSGTKHQTAAITEGKFLFFESAFEASLNGSPVQTIDEAKMREFELAVNSQNEYGTQLSVDLRG